MPDLCAHFSEAKNDIKPNTKGCEECEREEKLKLKKP